MEEREDKEVYRLVRDNNRLLRSMRRNAVIWGIIKILLYLGVLVVLPLWLYATYLAPIAENALGVLGQVQGVGAEAQNQLNAFQEILQKLNPAQYIGR
ncbi:hypothetical protein A2673_04025 [Candidatus Kaiserbacteria bacterium RIFCSPHIGHO2_01_FULL_50_13]|uniref:Uncharacterized protein n=1 Tax=Candidatus Kaiserbacteria bacterium RIFCSPLOWO2_01_FULL_50_24 TaxID=1798507 RepID=A0A1F6ENE0_9BACT|nr:MAG: hypothetical protein A2673_04025 [Candidatus Kaiserbacteria bacterium RIFCSPHIGHO2_01_FULL_50_13]OGG75159.1 MAG: hypothetical protein A3A34_02285 [Candidatus Kaiserbacteria bacterium RIFCSPLOWO2_01_FULL_50_24]OGG81051.1 MAG: hypothetical protein A3H74_00955 [Candidatus Kaiserbacteria bacterium RIFCSPLOWO2_02_FULL_51_13]